MPLIPTGSWSLQRANKLSIYVWLIDEDQNLLFIDVEEEKHFGLHVVAIALDVVHRLTAVVSDYLGKIYIARWQLSIVWERASLNTGSQLGGLRAGYGS